MAKSKNHTSHHNNRKDHRNGIKKPKRNQTVSCRPKIERHRSCRDFRRTRCSADNNFTRPGLKSSLRVLNVESVLPIDLHS